jgi:hypothetical protein
MRELSKKMNDELIPKKTAALEKALVLKRDIALYLGGIFGIFATVIATKFSWLATVAAVLLYSGVAGYMLYRDIIEFNRLNTTYNLGLRTVIHAAQEATENIPK